MHYIKNKNIMKFIIKSLKENIFINLLILIIFLSIFMQTNYDNIDRYLPIKELDVEPKIWELPNRKAFSNWFYSKTYRLQVGERKPLWTVPQQRLARSNQFWSPFC